MQSEHSPTLDGQPVNRDRKRTPTWISVFLTGFAVGAVWPLAIMMMNNNASPWMLITVYPGQVVARLFPLTDDSWKLVQLLPFVAVSISYGLLALLVYTVYRPLRRRIPAQS